MKLKQLNLRKSKMRVRFNLRRGDNFRKWQVISSDDERVHYDPWKVQLELQYCVLCNKRKVAQKIFNGEHKRVCSWINTKDVKVYPINTYDIADLKEVKYNPKEFPYWTDEHDNNVDDMVYSSLITDGNKIYIFRSIHD